LNLVRARLSAGEHRAVLGLDRDHAQRRLSRLEHLAHAVMVPPVPTPATNTSIAPAVSFRFLRR